jgi:hypothetical protein
VFDFFMGRNHGLKFRKGSVGRFLRHKIMVVNVVPN